MGMPFSTVLPGSWHTGTGHLTRGPAPTGIAGRRNNMRKSFIFYAVMAATPFTPALRAQYFARWPFDLINFNGTADDTSGNGHTLNINATFPSPSTVCQSAGCYQFNGQ